MRVVSVSGARGSGKTSLICELTARLSTKGKSAAVIVNEQGDAVYEQAFIQSHELQVRTIRGG
jgi:G3E family GTPase